MKKLVALLLFVSLLTGGAFAQLMFGVTGDLHMDTNMTSSEIMAQFKDGSNIFYGPFAELAFGNLGIGFAGTFQFWTDTWTDPAYPEEMMTYDVAAYLSYHLFRARAFLDPFGELGVGYIAYDYAANDLDPNNPLAASVFWYGALGLGVNLGSLGVFGKMSYNNALPNQLDAVDSSGNSLGYKVPYYGYYDTLGNLVRYVPAMRFTIGVKLIL